MKNLMKIGLALVALSCASGVQAKEKFTLEYAKDSPIQNVPLNNSTIVLKMYRYEKPAGFKYIKTNGMRSFFLNNNEDFEVVGIVGEKKRNARCSGYGMDTNQKIIIRCREM